LQGETKGQNSLQAETLLGQCKEKPPLQLSVTKVLIELLIKKKEVSTQKSMEVNGHPGNLEREIHK